MKVGVIGGGAIGLLCASMFQKIGLDVTLFTRTALQAERIRQEGIVLHTKDKCERIKINASHRLEDGKGCDVIIVTVKQYHLDSVLKDLQALREGKVVFLQNGMGHLEKVKALRNVDVYLGIVEHGAKRLAMNTVFFTGNGRIVLGVRRMQTWVERLIVACEGIFPIHIEKDIVVTMKRKLVANVCINSLTALFEVKNGELIQNTYYNQLMKQLFDEVVDVLHYKESNDLWEYVQGICLKTASNSSSMLRDLQEGRQTEVDDIVGYVKGLGKENCHPLIHFCYVGIKGKEFRGGDN